jgi:hypothetical protein
VLIFFLGSYPFQIPLEDNKRKLPLKERNKRLEYGQWIVLLPINHVL